jgi:hypothetical protein
MSLFYRIGADLIFLLHFCWVMLGMFAWLAPELWYLYLFVVVSTLVSYLGFKNCIFTRWEFALRRKAGQRLDYSSDWIPYYTYKLGGTRVSDRFLLRAGTVFLISTLALNLYFRYFFS